MSLDLLQAGGSDEAVRLLTERRIRLMRRYGESLSCFDLLRGLVLPRVAEALLKRAGIGEDAACDEKMAERLASLLADCRLTVAGIGDPEVCQVQRGGFSVGQFDPQTMQANDFPGLYVTGEALDVDGPCGGYNLHWAWGSGLLAGRACAEHLASRMSADESCL